MSLNDYFKEKLNVEERAIPQVLAWLEKDFHFKLFEDVRQKQAFQEKDIDFLMQDQEGLFKTFPLELKVRKQYYPDIAIETLSSIEANTLGYIKKSQALFLAYVWLEQEQLHSNRFLFNLSALRDWFLENYQKYPRQTAPNPPENPIYHTEFYSVPFGEIPWNIKIKPRKLV